MRIRRQRRSSFWSVWGTAVISVAALVVIAAAAALMLFAASPAAAEEIPRRHDGRPDLSGTYDIATLTPAQRPERYGERLALTLEEAAAIADHWETNFNKDHAPSDPNREAPPKGGTGIYAPEFTGAAGKVGVDTTNFREIRGSVARASRDLHVVERISRIDADTLRYQFTVEDPVYETAWRGEYPWPATGNRLYEYGCHEGNYALGGILRGARLLEQEAIEQGQAGTSTGSGSGD